MSRNHGNTSLKTKRRSEDPMREFDRLPPELRIWMSTAILPWRAKSVQRVFGRALVRTGSRALAIQELDRIQNQRIAQDAAAVWGPNHPYLKTDVQQAC
ncbi:MAG: DUF6525 family protein [Pseudoruegeria sp.]